MNIPLSLLVYNPIEAYAIILLCDIITGNRTKFSSKMILYLYAFSTVNAFIQMIPMVWIGRSYFAFINIAINYIITPFSIRFFYRIITAKISYKRCFIVGIIDCLFIIIITSILSFVLKDYNMFYTENICHELITNIIIFSVQITLYLIIRIIGDHYYEKFRKGCS